MNLKDFEPMLPINKMRLDDELEIQAQISYKIAEETGLANSRQMSAKEDLNRYEAELRIKLITAVGDEKPMSDTKALIVVATDTERTRLWHNYQVARAAYESWMGLYTAWGQRGYALKTLADLHLGEYYTITAAGKENSDSDYSKRRQMLARSRTAVAETTEVPSRATRVKVEV